MDTDPEPGEWQEAPDQGQDEWRLSNVEALHRADPDGFEIPPWSERRTLEPGDFAKLVFRVEDGSTDGQVGEEMWVRIVGIESDWYEGELDDPPLVIRSLTLGSPVIFSAQNVVDIRHQF